MKQILSKLKSHEDLSAAEIQQSLGTILLPETAEEDIKAFLILLSEKGESAEEIAAAAHFLRSHASMLNAPEGAVDCCGTGGDVSGTYNISTAVALVCAACGVPVAKHGNRAASSKSGAADVLEALGVNLDVDNTKLENALQKYNFAFLMAPKHHQVLKPLAPIRKSLQRPTIFNLLGPLANPAGTKIQLLGVYDKKWCRPMAEALKILGTKRAWVVHGRDGLDEISLIDKTDVVALEEDGSIHEFVIDPEEHGVNLCATEDLKGGDATQNAQALENLLEGAPSAYRDITLLNAAAVLVLSGSCDTLPNGIKKAEEAIDSGHVKANFEAYKKETGTAHE